jgi:hypothetical protein
MVVTNHLFQAALVSSKPSGVKQFLHERPLFLLGSRVTAADRAVHVYPKGSAKAGKDGLLSKPLGRILHRQTSWPPVCLCTCASALLPDHHKKCTPPCLRKGCTGVRAPRQWHRMSYRYIPWCFPFPPHRKIVTWPERLVCYQHQ